AYSALNRIGIDKLATKLDSWFAEIFTQTQEG
ncbi:YihA family ribosome biogenesis GTP-binding protein, partial [Glaesserella parasuis]|nr:YihA family ribosome biogenesis GTP-binding protein [Glaesserella parasuis]MDO9788106.1 YihA family ribosome biogenesis GTP-binding protein [Glaesserella parasuis]MDO9805341.1 YihA family ribosome biogenesis GTP-binding protein [Glaesserella parasuis]MDO9806459.1 YihA family ribosome biogenesis GTP-binding protein [Glaesserella parasuis]MDP0015917.1 YihA family ribosome biogenesis GTP-binding protein [Glaesserella parasuis]